MDPRRDPTNPPPRRPKMLGVEVGPLPQQGAVKITEAGGASWLPKRLVSEAAGVKVTVSVLLLFGLFGAGFWLATDGAEARGEARILAAERPKVCTELLGEMKLLRSEIVTLKHDLDVAETKREARDRAIEDALRSSRRR